METQTPALSHRPDKDYSAKVDTSRPFRSVKEAVAIFGERLLVGEIYSPKPFPLSPAPENGIITSWNCRPSLDDDYDGDENPTGYDIREREGDDQGEVLDTLRKLEAELEETKLELMLLKKRESQTEIAVATLNAELQNNMSKLAEAEAAAAAEKVATDTDRTTTSLETGSQVEENRIRSRLRRENSTTLAQILCVRENDCCFGGRKGRIKTPKKKPIMPLVTDLFKTKGSSHSTVLHSTLYQSPNMYLK